VETKVTDLKKLVPKNFSPDTYSHLPDKFVYGGKGYFFRPYDASGFEAATRMFGEFLEGSLLDFQLGDLLSACNAGDIRVYFEVATFPSVSIIAKLSAANGELEFYRSSTGYPLAIVEEGIHSVPDMLSHARTSARTTLLLHRALLYVWALVVLLPFGNFLDLLFPAVFLTGLATGINWLLIYGLIPTSLAFTFGSLFPFMYFAPKMAFQRSKRDSPTEH
jgi:hypothetical protein